MGYVIAAVIAVAIIAAVMFVLVNRATNTNNVSDAPAGDTPEHAPSDEGGRFGRQADEPDVARPVVGGEAEGERSAR